MKGIFQRLLGHRKAAAVASPPFADRPIVSAQPAVGPTPLLVAGFPYVQGVILHAAIVGAFRAMGGSFEVWCADNGVAPSIARNATFGVAKGPKGRALLAKLISAAGPDVVQAGYLARFKRHAEDLKQGVA